MSEINVIRVNSEFTLSDIMQPQLWGFNSGEVLNDVMSRICCCVCCDWRSDKKLLALYLNIDAVNYTSIDVIDVHTRNRIKFDSIYPKRQIGFEINVRIALI